MISKENREVNIRNIPVITSKNEKIIEHEDKQRTFGRDLKNSQNIDSLITEKNVEIKIDNKPKVRYINYIIIESG